MPFCPTDPCENCWCCMEVCCRQEFGGCHEPLPPAPPSSSVQPLLLKPPRPVKMLPPMGLKWTND